MGDEWRADASDGRPVYAVKELETVSYTQTKEKQTLTGWVLSCSIVTRRSTSHSILWRCQCPPSQRVRLDEIPSEEIFCFTTEMYIVRERKVIPPIHDLPVDVMCILRAERRVAWMSNHQLVNHP